MITIDRFFKAFESFSGYAPYPAQEEAIRHANGPLWILAGPGTGKSEVLVLRTLKLLLVDGLKPESILLTTFTEKAARNLHDRLSSYLIGILGQPGMKKAPRPDLSRLWLGTLHSLAHTILLDMDEASEDLDLLDETAALFLFLREVRSKHTFGPSADALYRQLMGSSPKFVGRIGRAQRLLGAMHRPVEDDIDWDRFRTGRPLRGKEENWPEGVREMFLELCDAYEKQLGRQVDFARVQSRFLAFLTSDRAKAFLQGDPARQLPGIKQVIVDEYQDTNPIQESIYFALAQASGNLIVVGDDDQALYRFRGASVDAMVSFKDRASQALKGAKVRVVNLDENRRSHPDIVASVNHFVASTAGNGRFGSARTPKKKLRAKSTITGGHVPACVLVRETAAACAGEVARTVEALIAQGEISDHRQVALLSPSTRLSQRSPFMPYQAAFQAAGVPLYNPRGKDFNKDEHLKALLGALWAILDPAGDYVTTKDLQKLRLSTDQALKGLSGAKELQQFVSRQAKAFDLPQSTQPYAYFSRGLLDLTYLMLSFEPFRSAVDGSGGVHAAQLSWRLGQVTALMGAFEAAQGGSGIPRATTRSRQWFHLYKQTPPAILRGVDSFYANNFARNLMEAFQSGGFSDVEDDIVAFPAGMVPALTIHQAKGLEFSLVFVCGVTSHFGPGASHHQEDLFAPYRRRPRQGQFSAEERAIHDTLRQYFVAFSRPKYGLVLCLERGVYDGILDGSLAQEYPHIPATWLKKIGRV